MPAETAAADTLGLQRYVQKIVDAASGATAKVELLSRPKPPLAAGFCLDGFFKALGVEAHFELAAAQIGEAAALSVRGPILCSINLDNAILTDQGLRADLVRLIDETATEIAFEVTEHKPLPPAAEMNSFFRELRGLSCTIALDDFGSGFNVGASLFQDYDFDVIKLDRRLIALADTSSKAERVLGMMVKMIQASGKELVAEGIERPEQSERLLGLGVAMQQGFLFHRPQPLSEFEVAS